MHWSGLIIETVISGFSPRYSNKEVIAVSQDKMGKQGKRVAGQRLAPFVGSQFASVKECELIPGIQQEVSNFALLYVDVTLYPTTLIRNHHIVPHHSNSLP